MKERRILGVDYGDARTGIAISDADGRFAGGVGVIRAKGMRSAARQTADEAARRGAQLIVVGLPLNMDGTEGARAEKARAFSSMLSELTGLPVVMQDERLTTVEAYDIMDEIGVHGARRRDIVDTMSAELILREYLESHGDEV